MSSHGTRIKNSSIFDCFFELSDASSIQSILKNRGDTTTKIQLQVTHGMNLKTKSKLDVVSDSLRISKDDILAYGDVKLYVYYKDEAQKVRQQHCLFY